MNNQAIQQKRIRAISELPPMKNMPLGSGWSGWAWDYTYIYSSRKILMERLSGHTAFRTPADAEKAKAKAQKKRDELRAAKEAARLAAENRENRSAADATPTELQLMASGA